MSWTKKTLLIVAIPCLLIVLPSATFLAGYLKGHPKHGIRSLYESVTGRLQFKPSPAQPASISSELEPVSIRSTFLTLAGPQRVVPAERIGVGGGITEFGSEILILTHEGKVWGADANLELTELKLNVPDNGYAGFARHAESPEYADFKMHPPYLRYNDIIAYEAGDRRFIALSFTRYEDARNCYKNVIALLAVEPSVTSAVQLEAEASDWRFVYEAEPCLPLKPESYALEGQMAGGRLAFKPPASLYLTSGDYFWDGIYSAEAVPQRDDMEYGKVIEINVISWERRIFSKGHRNAQGIAIDRNGDIWVTEHGPRGGDELNLVQPGGNYGWPLETLGARYMNQQRDTPLVVGRHEMHTPPVFAWLPSIAPANLTFVEGFHESWDGDLLLGSLAARTLFRLRIENQRVVFAEPIPFQERIRDLLIRNDGVLAVWTDSKILMFLSPIENRVETARPDRWIEATFDLDLANRIKGSLNTCTQCHSLAPEVHVPAPSLAGIYQAPIAATSYQGYSAALRNMDGRWTRDRLRQYIRDPQGFANGTTMPAVFSGNDEVLDAIIDVLAELASYPAP